MNEELSASQVEQVEAARLSGEVIASPEDRAVIASLRRGDWVQFDSVMIKGGRIHVAGAHIVRLS